MKHLIVNDFGVFLGLTSQRATVKKEGKLIGELPLSRLKSIQIHSSGVSLSSDLVASCSARGIKIFFNNKGTFSALHSPFEHKSVEVRKFQYKSSESSRAVELARKIIIGKIRNQRATLLYSTRTLNIDNSEIKNSFDILINQLKNKKEITKEFILGIEGHTASLYFKIIKELNLFPQTFKTRTGRYSEEITNIALNYGYAILSNYIYKAVVNAGLEPYQGVLHSNRSGKPSLVLDIMEEYRSFLVDRNIIKLRSRLENSNDFNKIKRVVASEILKSIGSSHKYNNKRLTVESIIQRQVYKISAYFCGVVNYKSYTFRW